MGKVGKKSIPAKTVNGRENQLIALAVDETEKRLRNGTASSQIICQLLKLATTKAQLELEKLRSDIEVSRAKVTQIENSEKLQESYEKAISAMKMYSGLGEDDYDEYDEEWD